MTPQELPLVVSLGSRQGQNKYISSCNIISKLPIMCSVWMQNEITFWHRWHFYSTLYSLVWIHQLPCLCEQHICVFTGKGKYCIMYLPVILQQFTGITVWNGLISLQYSIIIEHKILLIDILKICEVTITSANCRPRLVIALAYCCSFVGFDCFYCPHL